MSSRLPKKMTPLIAPGLKLPALVTPRRKSALLCTGCGKPTSQTFTPNQCVRCKATTYCSRRCQASDWPFHKRICNRPAPSPARILTPSPVTNPIDHTHTLSDIINPRIMTSVDHWLGTLPELACYHLIIDTYRLRLDSEWGSVERFCSGDYQTLLTHFHEFLEGAMAVRALPGWWGEDNMIACARVAIDETADACILHTVKELKAAVAVKYADKNMSEQLLCVAERVYGWCASY